MFCTKCGKELKGNYKVCPKCGQKVDTSTETVENKNGSSNSNNDGGGKVVAFIVSVIIGIVLMKANHPIIGGAFIIEGILALTSFKWLKKIVIEAIAVVIICLFVRNGNDDTIKVSNEYTDETQDELNMPDQNQIEYDEEDTNNMMWPDLEYYADITDNYKSAYYSSETPEAKEFFANEDNIWFVSSEYEYDPIYWHTTDGSDRKLNVRKLKGTSNGGCICQVSIEYPDIYDTAIDFNPLPAKIAPTGEMIYYFDFAGDSICMTYFPEDGHIHIESGKDDYRGDYYAGY